MEIAAPTLSKKGRKEPPVLNALAPQWTVNNGGPRLLIIGASGTGKSYLLKELLMKYIPWETLQMICRTTDTPDYVEMKKVLGRWDKDPEHPKVFWSEDLNATLMPEHFNPKVRTFTTFDDWMMNKDLTIPCEHFIRSRPKNGGCAFLAQEYFKVPTTIRGNASMVIVFRGLKPRDVSELHKDVGGHLSIDEFRRLYRDVTTQPFGFMVFDRFPAKPELAIRIGFDKLVLE